jgi:hypothetical protein
MSNPDKPSMNADIKEFGVHVVTPAGRIFKTDKIQSVNDYNHYSHHIHHYIKQQQYNRDKKWFIEKGIQQKLFLIPAIMHQHLEDPIYRLSEKDFLKKYKVSRQRLLFNKSWSEY